MNDPISSSIKNYICTNTIPKEWEQPFTFKSNSYALYQRDGGPCGLISSLQSYICLSLQKNPNSSPEILLINAILDIMYKIRKSYVICVNIDDQNKYVDWFGSTDRQYVFDYLYNTKWYLQTNATILFTFSIVILLGPVWLNTYSFPDTFISNGQTNLTFVLLLLTGDVLDSFHDGNILADGLVLKGATKEQPVGFVSISESDEYQNVGKYFSNPTKNIWLGYYGGHFTTILKTNDNLFIEFDGLNHSNIMTFMNSNHIFYSRLPK